MKKLIIVIAILIGFTVKSHCSEVVASHFTYHQQQAISDGWYKAKVEYYNDKTQYKNTYTLKVKVSYGSVTVIDFGNGGSVHSGYNNEGYYYSGGSLTIHRDYSGNVTYVDGTVTVTEGGTTKTFTITIS